MKTRPLVALLAAWLAVGCHSAAPMEPAAAAAAAARHTTQITLSGTEGAAVNGYYIQDGRRVEIADDVPWTLEAPGISDVRIEKVLRADTVIADVRYYKDGALVSSRYTLGPAVRSIRILVGAGVNATTATTATNAPATPAAPTMTSSQ